MKYAVYLSNLRKDLKKSFAEKNIDVNDVDCILMEVLNISFSDLRKDRLLATSEVNTIMKCVEERKQGKPVTKIFHKAYFYGYEFYVDENVLSPRCETELLVDTALEFLIDKPNAKVLDLCTGSGAIACAIYKKSKVSIVATDISEQAIEIAKRNAKNLECEIDFVKSDMFKNVSGQFDLILSNPPYIESDTCLNLDREVKDYDPILALDGGEDGLNFYRIIKDNMKYLKTGGKLVMEIGFNQGEAIKKIFKDYNTKVIKDYSNNDRIVVVEK